MTPEALPSIVQEPYNHHLYGHYGELGKSHFGVRFLQTALHISEINKLTLVSEIADSEQWPVRELFQRDVDEERVRTMLMPYFKKPTKIKFFNPLTIVVLPIDRSGRVLQAVSETRSEDTEYAEGTLAQCLEAKGYYKIQVPEDRPQWSCVRWNSDKVKLVAVDGQHRLSALQRIYREYVVLP